MGLIAGSEEISERETFALLFHPGFTLKEEVTTISGRGIGLDAVREVVIKLSGTIDIESVHGKGTKFIIKTPLGKNGIPEGGR